MNEEQWLSYSDVPLVYVICEPFLAIAEKLKG
jgi:hypothetical protein